MLVDLDQGNCAAEYAQQLLPERTDGLLLRIVVREIEAWLLADRENLARYLNIAVENVPLNPDDLPDPKAALVALARKCKKTAIRDDIVPRLNSGVRVGPGYVKRITEFVNHADYPWRPGVAAQHSDSLRRCIAALMRWKSPAL